MSIQSSINSALSTIGSLKKLDKLAEEQAKQSKELAKLTKYELTDEEEYAAIANFEDERNLRKMKEYIDNMDPESDAYKRTKKQYDETVDRLSASRTEGPGAEAERKRYLNQLRQGVASGGIYTPEDIQNAQMDMYKNLATLKLGEVNDRARYASGAQQYDSGTQYDLSNEDWGVQG